MTITRNAAARRLLRAAFRLASTGAQAARAASFRRASTGAQAARAASAAAAPAAATAPSTTRRRDEPGVAPITRARESFFKSLELEGDFALASVTVIRRYLEIGTLHRGRTLAQVLQQQDGQVREVGDICMGLLAARSGLIADAWQLFSAVDTAEVLRLAPAEYFRAGFAQDPDLALKMLDAVDRGDLTAVAGPSEWLDIAQTSFVARAGDLSRRALERAEAGLDDIGRQQARELRTRIERLEEWYQRAGTATDPVPMRTGEAAIALMGYRQPDPMQSSRDVGDYFETLATLAQLARHAGVHYTGEPSLVEVAEALRGRVRPQLAIDGDDAVVRLFEVDRDATSYTAVSDGAWLIVTGRLALPTFGAGVDLPYNRRLRPIFLSVHIDDTALLTAEVLAYLRRHAPIGCRDWGTVLLLQAAEVPAFFAGAIAATLDTIASDAPTLVPAPRLYVDTPATRAGDTASEESGRLPTRRLSENLEDALHRFDEYRRYRRIVTSRLQTYLCARAVGIPVRLVPENAAARCWYGLADLDADGFEEMRAGIRDRLAEVYRAILAGQGADDVYALWRRRCAPDVAYAEAQRRTAPEVPPPSFDFRAACATIQAAAVTIERTAPAPPGPEINVEFSLDGNYKHQLEVVLDSILTHTSRPIRAFVLCREHAQADYDRMAALFPTASFVWLPTDGVDYGSLRGLLSYTTVATMDRLLLPDLLPDVDRIVHHDLDALCLTDLAELYDLDMRGNPIAGCRQPQLKTISGFAAFMRKSEKFSGNPARAREYLRLTHLRHSFDFEILNAGIMLLDLAVMRADRFCEIFLPWADRFGMNDQGVLNVYAGGNRIEVNRGWNWRPWLGSIPEPKIAHWAGPFKPWQRNWVYGRDLWRAGEARVAGRYEMAGLR